MPEPDLSSDRIEVARAVLGDAIGTPGWSGLPTNARMLYVVGLLTCDDRGVVTLADTHRAMDRPDVLQAARQLLAEVAD